MKKINEKIANAYKNGYGVDVVNLSLLNIAKNRELKRLIVHKHNLWNKDDLITDLHYSKLMYENIARQNFEYMTEEIAADNPHRLTGYSNMINFD